jgi:hypothetical protein
MDRPGHRHHDGDGHTLDAMASARSIPSVTRST